MLVNVLAFMHGLIWPSSIEFSLIKLSLNLIWSLKLKFKLVYFPIYLSLVEPNFKQKPHISLFNLKQLDGLVVPSQSLVKLMPYAKLDSTYKLKVLSKQTLQVIC